MVNPSFFKTYCFPKPFDRGVCTIFPEFYYGGFASSPHIRSPRRVKDTVTDWEEILRILMEEAEAAGLSWQVDEIEQDAGTNPFSASVPSFIAVI